MVFIEKETGNKIPIETVRSLVARVMKDSNGIFNKVEACAFVAGMFQDTNGMLIYHAIDELASQEAKGRAMLDKLSEDRISPMRERRFPLLEKTFDSGPGKLSKYHADAIPNASWYPKMDAYGHMRAMVLAASLPDEPRIASGSVTQDHPFSVGYSQADQDIIDKAARLCGFSPAKLSNGYSSEEENIHRHSPVNHNSGKHK